MFVADYCILELRLIYFQVQACISGYGNFSFAIFIQVALKVDGNKLLAVIFYFIVSETIAYLRTVQGIAHVIPEVFGLDLEIKFSLIYKFHEGNIVIFDICADEFHS